MTAICISNECLSFSMLEVVESVTASRLFKKIVKPFISIIFSFISFGTFDAVCHNLVTALKILSVILKCQLCLICMLTMYCYIPGLQL